MTLDPSFSRLLESLIRFPSVVGSEHSFFRVLQRELEERGATVQRYEGLLVATGSEPSRRFLSAHIDRHGLICTGHDEFQYAAFVAANRSDQPNDSVSLRLLNTIADRFSAMPVFAYEPWSGVYMGRGQIETAQICARRNNLVFQISGLAHVVAGSPIAFSDRLNIRDQRVIGQLDNVLTTAMLVHLFDLGFEGTAFFTAQEEAGRSWRFLLEWFRRFGESTNRLIVLDTSPYADQTAADQQDVVLRRRDANAEFDTATTDEVEAVCMKKNIRYTFKDRFIEEANARAQAEGRTGQSLGSTEMGRIISASGGLVSGTTLQIPTTGYHTMFETASTRSCNQAIGILKELCFA